MRSLVTLTETTTIIAPTPFVGARIESARTESD